MTSQVLSLLRGYMLSAREQLFVSLRTVSAFKTPPPVLSKPNYINTLNYLVWL